MTLPLCMFCKGTGWCEGSPAFTCPRCHGTGVEKPKPSHVTWDGNWVCPECDMLNEAKAYQCQQCGLVLDLTNP